MFTPLELVHATLPLLYYDVVYKYIDFVHRMMVLLVLKRVDHMKPEHNSRMME